MVHKVGALKKENRVPSVRFNSKSSIEVYNEAAL